MKRVLQADAPPPANNLTCPKILRHIYSNIHSLGGLLSSIVGAASTDCGARNASAVGCLVSRTLRNAKADLHSSEGGPNGCECGPHEQRVQTGPEVGDQNTNPNKQKGSHSQEPHFEATTASVRCRAGSEGRCLAVETDPEEYRVRLLEETWVVLNERAPQFRGGQSEEDDHGWTQTELVNRAIELHFQKGGRPNDVLCQGHQRPGAHARKQGQPLPNISGVECLGLSSAFAAVTSTPWELLLSRIGAPAMLHLLRNSSTFVPLPNGCLLQVCGRPITDLVWKKRLQQSATPQGVPPQPASVSRKRKRAGVAVPSYGSKGPAHVRFGDKKRRRLTPLLEGKKCGEDGCAKDAKQRTKSGPEGSPKQTNAFGGRKGVTHQEAEGDRRRLSGRARKRKENEVDSLGLEGQSHPPVTSCSGFDGVSEDLLSQEPGVGRMRGGAEARSACHVAGSTVEGVLDREAFEETRTPSDGMEGIETELDDVIRKECDRGCANLIQVGKGLREAVRPRDSTPCLEPFSLRAAAEGSGRAGSGVNGANVDCASRAGTLEENFGFLTQEASGREPEGTIRKSGKRKRVRESSWQRKRRRRAAVERDAAGERACPEGLGGLEAEPVTPDSREAATTQEIALAGARKKSHRVVIRGKGASVAVSRKKAPGLSARPDDQPNGPPNSRQSAPVRSFDPGNRIHTRMEKPDSSPPTPSKASREWRGPILSNGLKAKVSTAKAATQRPDPRAKGSPTARAAKSAPRLLPRAAMFYNASHGRKAGLPTTHVLSSLGTNCAAAKALVRHVFEPASAAPVVAKPKPRTSFQAAFGSIRPEVAKGCVNTEVNERRVPRQLRAAVPLFRDLLVGVKRLDMGRLLARHCPLPETLRKPGGKTGHRAGTARQEGREERAEAGGEGQKSQLGFGSALEPGLSDAYRSGAAPGAKSGSAAGLDTGSATGLATDLASDLLWERGAEGREGPVEASGGREEQREDADCMDVQGLSDGYLTQDEEEGLGVKIWRESPTGDEEENMFDGENPHEIRGGVANRKTGSISQQETEAGGPQDEKAGDVGQNKAPDCAPLSQHSAGDDEGLAALLPNHLAPDATYKQLIGQFCEHRHVAAFVWTALRKAVPKALLGGPHGSASARALRGHVNRFVRLGRFETMSLADLMHGLRLADFPWLWEGESRSGGAVSRGIFGEGKEKSAGGRGVHDSGGAASGGSQPGVVLAVEWPPGEITARVQAFLRENEGSQNAMDAGSPVASDADVPLTQEPQIEDSNIKTPLLARRLSTMPPTSKQMPKFPPEKTAALRRRLSEWLYFLFASLVVPLLRSHFYVTESEPHKQKVFYYRKPVWRHLAALSVRHLAGPGGPYCHVAAAEAEALLASKGRVFGAAEMRLLPKANGMRPIARLGARSTVLVETRADQKRVSDAGVRTWFRRKGSLSGLQWRRNGQEGGQVREQRRNSDSFRRHPKASGQQPAALGPQAYGFGRSADTFGRGSNKVGRNSDGVGRAADATGQNLDAFGRPGARGFVGAATTAASCPLPTSKVLEFGAPNKLLGDAHAILKLEKWRGGEGLGCSVFGFDDIHAKLRGFVRGLRTEPGAPMPKVFMAGCDIAAAYDTIPQEFLWQIVQALFRSPVYQLLWNARATPAFGAVRVRGEKVATSVDVSEPHVAYRAFQEALRRLTSQKAGGAVFVDQVNCSETSRGKQLQLIREHLFGSVVRYGRAYLHQRRGIAQGSILSTLFCSFFYAHLENNVLLPLLERKAREEALFGGGGTERGDGTERGSGMERGDGTEQGSGTERGEETERDSGMAEARSGGGAPRENWGVGRKDRRFGGDQEGEGLKRHENPVYPHQSDIIEAVLLCRPISESEEVYVTPRLGADLPEGFGADRPLNEGLSPPSPSRAPSDGVNEPPEPRTPEHVGTEAWLRMESSETESEGEDFERDLPGGGDYCSDEGGCFWGIEQGYASQDEGTSSWERHRGGVGRGKDWAGEVPPGGGANRPSAKICAASLEGAGASKATRAVDKRNEISKPTRAADKRKEVGYCGTQLERGAGVGAISDHGANSENEEWPAPANENGPRGSGCGPQSLLMRWVDDSLFLSTIKRHVAAYLGAMHAGFPAYGAEANPAKTCLNFDLDDEKGGLRAQNMYVDGSGRSFIRWCGLLLNSDTLEVQADYTRYGGEYVRDSMAVDVTKGRRGAILADRLCLWLRPKCHAVFFDTAINSPTTVRLNIFQAFLLCAIKFHCFLSASGGDPRSNPPFLAREIRKAIGYMSAAVGTAREAARRRGTGCSGNVSKSQVIWLGLCAFRRVLGRKQTQYQPLLKLLANDFGREAKQLSETLSAAVAPDLSAVFEQVLY